MQNISVYLYRTFRPILHFFLAIFSGNILLKISRFIWNENNLCVYCKEKCKVCPCLILLCIASMSQSHFVYTGFGENFPFLELFGMERRRPTVSRRNPDRLVLSLSLSFILSLFQDSAKISPTSNYLGWRWDVLLFQGEIKTGWISLSFISLSLYININLVNLHK